jgi:hypothetical protein
MKTMKELRLENPNTRILYHLTYWDGALSGVCLYEGKKQYFEMIHEDMWSYMDEWPEWEKYCKQNDIEIILDDYPDEDGDVYYYTARIFAIYDTPDDVMEIIDENYQLFCKYVGTHCNYDSDGKRGRGATIRLSPDEPEDLGDMRPYSEHDKFYKSERRSANMDKQNWKMLEMFIYPF